MPMSMIVSIPMFDSITNCKNIKNACLFQFLVNPDLCVLSATYACSYVPLLYGIIPFMAFYTDLRHHIILAIFRFCSNFCCA